MRYFHKKVQFSLYKIYSILYRYISSNFMIKKCGRKFVLRIFVERTFFGREFVWRTFLAENFLTENLSCTKFCPKMTLANILPEICWSKIFWSKKFWPKMCWANIFWAKIFWPELILVEFQIDTPLYMTLVISHKLFLKNTSYCNNFLWLNLVGFWRNKI